MRHCKAIADDAQLPTYLTAFPSVHDFHVRFRYENRKSFDVDLNEWSKKEMTGFGIYRNYGMVREIRGVKI